MKAKKILLISLGAVAVGGAIYAFMQSRKKATTVAASSGVTTTTASQGSTSTTQTSSPGTIKTIAVPVGSQAPVSIAAPSAPTISKPIIVATTPAVTPVATKQPIISAAQKAAIVKPMMQGLGSFEMGTNFFSV